MSKILQILTELTIIDILEIKKTNAKLNWFDASIDILSPQNIQQLLIDLDLGESPETINARDLFEILQEKITICSIDALKYNTALDLLFSIKSFKDGEYPKTQAKALSDKWFSLQEIDGKPTPSLWNSGEKGQIQVLTELKTILENYLKN